MLSFEAVSVPPHPAIASDKLAAKPREIAFFTHVDLDQTVTEKTRFIYDIDIAGVSAEDKERVLRIISTCPVKETLARPMEFHRKDDEDNQRE